ncbi:protein INVOLVED IN DE NOVO 2-like [Hordeum vulgare]|nr:protein INVOLVED IN DE NOVO 2-like [Hordeum vulgare]
MNLADYMTDSRGRDVTIDALTSMLESRIYYHRDAAVEYLDIKTMVDKVVEEKNKLLNENAEFLNTIDKVVEEKEKLQHDHEVINELVAPMAEQLEMVKELEEEKYEHVAAKEELAVAKEQLAQKNKELKVLRRKLHESEAMHSQHEQQNGSTSEPAWSKMYLGVKEMGKLSEKLLQDACAVKLAPKYAVTKASELYTLWQELLDSPNWNPFKSVIVDDNCQEEVIDVDDDKLEGLKMAWGEGPYNAVIGALVERKEYNTDGTGDAFDLWNYKEGRKATLGECVDCIFDKVKKLKRFHLTYRYGVGDYELITALLDAS